MLKNYTSNVDAAASVYRIEQMLVANGATAIVKDYDSARNVAAIHFRIVQNGQEMMIRLPANVDAVQNILWNHYNKKGGGKKTRESFFEQAQRTAWKIVFDWVQVQMSMVRLAQAETFQVFLPYMFDGRQTFYASLKDRKFAGLLPPSVDA